jgi:hypothetical protein
MRCGGGGEFCFCSLSVHPFGCRMAVLFKLLSRLQLSRYKTCTHTTITIQNTSTYNYHNTKHVNLQLSQYKTLTHILSQYKTRIHTTITIKNMYTYNYHNRKHVHIQLSQYKTCTHTTITIQNV